MNNQKKQQNCTMMTADVRRTRPMNGIWRIYFRKWMVLLYTIERWDEGLDVANRGLEQTRLLFEGDSLSIRYYIRAHEPKGVAKT